jgi:hypothetical protein
MLKMTPIALRIVKYYTLLLCLFSSMNLLFSQSLSQAPWQQKVDYDMNVLLIDSINFLSGNSEVTYQNNSPDTLTEIWVHLWPNAYSSTSTAFAKQQLNMGSTSFYYSTEDEKGWIECKSAVNDDSLAKLSPDANNPDYAKISLENPLLPGTTLKLKFEFDVKIPGRFSRFGHNKQSYQITQWFPKIAMYDVNGWHPMSYVDMGEFYDNFGDYRVNITVPKNYVVAATGILQTDSEIEWLESRKPKSFGPPEHGFNSSKIPSSKEMKTITFTQDNVHDFAWFAAKNYYVFSDSVQLESGRWVKTHLYRYNFLDSDTAKLYAINKSIAFYSKHVGEYPYESATVVEGALEAGGGMEYPMITVISYLIEEVIVHEVGHNWFQGILGTDERKYPWMDEGINSYYEGLYMAQNKKEKKGGFVSYIMEHQTELGYKHLHRMNEDQAPGLHSEDYRVENYGLIVYGKVPLMFSYLNQYLGDSVYTKCMHTFYDEWKFKHPLPKDIQDAFEKVSGKGLNWFFVDAINNKTTVDFRPNGPVLLPHGKDEEDYKKSFALSFVNKLESNDKTRLYALPSIAWNEHNSFMAGVFLFNKLAIHKKVEFNVMPLYSFSNKSLNGFSNITWRVPVKHDYLYRTDFKMAVSAFDHEPYSELFHYTKLKPSVTLNFENPRKPSSNARRNLELSYYYIQSDGKTARNFRESREQFVRATWNWNKHSVINNTKYQIGVEWGKNGIGLDSLQDNYVKLFGELNRKLNYNSRGKFLKVRLFAAGFISKSDNISEKYNIHLSNNNGWSDYLLDDLFLMRNSAFKSGVLTQQLEQNNGAMRNLAPSVSTNKWLVSANLESTLPMNIPVRPFLDIGLAHTRSNNDDLDHELLYTGGLSIIVIENIFEVYVPLIYSDYFKDLYDTQETDFGNQISFRLNIPLMNPLAYELF